MELQMNVPPGVYVLETAVWDRNVGRFVASGPSARAEVRGGPGFWGEVQLNPHVQLLSEDTRV
jgi:hypothetical protein